MESEYFLDDGCGPATSEDGTADGVDFLTIPIVRFPSNRPSPLPPHSETSSAFAFFQNDFMKRGRLEGLRSSSVDSIASSSTSSLCSDSAKCLSEECGHGPSRPTLQRSASLDSIQRRTVNSSTLGGLDVYIRTGSIIHWTHHPQYAARIEHVSQDSFNCKFLGELSRWDDQFEFDPVTPFAKHWLSQGPGVVESEEARVNPVSYVNHVLRILFRHYHRIYQVVLPLAMCWIVTRISPTGRP